MYIWFITFFITNIITYYRNKHLNHDKIHDIFHFLELTEYKKICDIFPVLCLLCVSDYEKYLTCHAALILLRFICFNVTVLPPPMQLEIRYSFFIPNFQYDLLFSGHTMTCVLAIFFTSNVYSYYFTVIMSILCSIGVIVTKEHYTIDVIVAWLAAYSVERFFYH